MKPIEQMNGANEYKFDTPGSLLSAIKFEDSSDSDSVDSEYKLFTEDSAFTAALSNEASLNNTSSQELDDIKHITTEKPWTYKVDGVVIKEETEIDELVIKDELDISPVVLQPRTTPHLQPSTEEHDFVIKEETEIIELVVKDELDISPAVLQPRTTPHVHPSTEDPAPGTSVDGDATPAPSDALFVQSSPQSEIKDQHYEDDRKRLDNPNPGLRVDTNASDKASETQALCEPTLRVYSAPVKSSRVMRLRVRTAEKPHKCECRASESCQLGNLIHIHTDVKPLAFKQCDYKASQTNSLRNHMKKRMRKKTYQCKHCEYRSSQLAELIIHLRIHTGEKPYQYKHCEYTASQLVSLQRRMRKQMDEKPYQCNQCEYKSSHLSSLRTHLRIHTGEKLYQCKQCEYTASYPSALQRHMYKHTGEKPYHCEKCDYATSQKAHLQRHMCSHTD